jgi:SAM-dependent methyltransferase
MTADDGGFAEHHLANPVLLRLLGDVRDQRVLHIGSGEILASLGARVVRVEPGAGELTALNDLGEPFDAVVCSMVLTATPDWKPAMRACVEALRPGGRFVFAIVHPAFEELGTTWSEHGEYRIDRYLEEYEIPGPAGASFHRPLSAYLNELAALGCHLREVAEPGLDPDVAAAGEPALDAYVRLPNFLIVAATRT